MGLTETQEKYLEKFLELGSPRSVASFFGVRTETVSEHLKEAQRRCEVAREKILKKRTEAKGELAKSRKSPSPSELLKLAEDQDFLCALTGMSIKEASTASLDHKEPFSKTQDNSIGNLQWILKEINKMKGDLSNDRFIELCCMVADHNRKA